MTNPISTIVVTVREDREFIRLDTTDGPVLIDCTPVTRTRTKVRIRAPRSVQVLREKAPCAEQVDGTIP